MPPPVRPGRRESASRGLERGDIRKAVEVVLREWPNKSQQAIAGQVGCSQFTVHSVQKELIAANMLTLPAKRMGKDGKERPTAYATKTPTSATGTGLDIRPDIRRRGDRAGA